MKPFRAVFVVFVSLTFVTGVAYPLLIWAIAQIAFPHQANGSVIVRNGRARGSELIGQRFDDLKYFWSRPSATDPPYNPASSAGSNLGPTNPDLIKAVSERVELLRRSHPDQSGPVPADLVSASGSGLDPHISPEAAEFQVARVAKSRGLAVERVRAIVLNQTEPRTFGLLGEPRVNVLKLNLALDAER